MCRHQSAECSIKERTAYFQVIVKSTGSNLIAFQASPGFVRQKAQKMCLQVPYILLPSIIMTG